MKDVRRLYLVEYLVNSLPVSQVTLHETQPWHARIWTKTVELVCSHDVPTFRLQEPYKVAADETFGSSD